MNRRTVLAAIGMALGSGCLRLRQTSESKTPIASLSPTQREPTPFSTEESTPTPPPTEEPTPTPPPTEEPTPTDAAETAEPRSAGNLKWTSRAQTDVTGTPFAAGDTVYVGDRSGQFYALETAYGRHQWSRNLSRSAIKGQPAITSDTLFTTTLEELFALNPLTGATKWRADVFGRTILQSPITTSNTVYTGSEVGEIQARDPKTGSKKWAYNVNGTYPVKGAKGTIPTGGVAMEGKHIYVLSEDDREDPSGWIHILDATNGTEKVVQELATPRPRSSSQFTVAGETAVYRMREPTKNGATVVRFGAVDTTTGAKRWVKTSSDPPSLTLNGETLYATRSPARNQPGKAGLYAYDSTTGEVKWWVKGNYSNAPTISSDTIYAGKTTFLGERKVLALTLTGSKIWQTKLDTEPISQVGVGKNAIYVGASDGFFYGIWKEK